MGHDDDRRLGVLERLDRWADALLVSGGGVVERKVGGGRRMPERLETLPHRLPAGGLVPGAMQQAEHSHGPGIPRAVAWAFGYVAWRSLDRAEAL